MDLHYENIMLGSDLHIKVCNNFKTSKNNIQFLFHSSARESNLVQKAHLKNTQKTELLELKFCIFLIETIRYPFDVKKF